MRPAQAAPRELWLKDRPALSPVQSPFRQVATSSSKGTVNKSPEHARENNPPPATTGSASSPAAADPTYAPYVPNRFAELPDPSPGPHEDDSDPKDSPKAKCSMVDIMLSDNTALFASLSLSIQRGQRHNVSKHELGVPLRAALNFNTAKLELSGGFLTVASNGLPHTLCVAYDNAIERGADMVTLKVSNTGTMAAKATLGHTGIAVDASASVAVGKESSAQTQYPTTPPFLCKMHSNQVVAATVEVIPHPTVARNGMIAVEVNAKVMLPQRSQRDWPYALPIRFDAQWCLRDRSELNIGRYSLVVFEVVEDVWGGRGDWEDNLTRSVAVFPNYDATPNDDTENGFTQYENTTLLTMRERLQPKQPPWYNFRTLVRRIRHEKPQTLPAGAYQMWGPKGWMAVKIGELLQVPFDAQSLSPPFDALQLEYPMRFREARGSEET
ncbi:hypothetical protein MIND_01083100 [Mycena indigotica]|uniref:Uncharacterized protein n=1 Tax=Mycena indigotica TaxID=2126181 RepID=A0A8H6SCN6_9AGAR|nr:uncharacterized protein MIND_01083100 [Mycena indigotica]KAF7295435.1 hypothetical protein MIND_01083100 [Mycena indigotica]